MKSDMNTSSQNTCLAETYCHLNNAVKLLTDMAHSAENRKALVQLIQALDSASITTEQGRHTLTNSSGNTL